MNIYCWEGYNQKDFLNDLPLKVNSNNFISDYIVATDIKKKVIKCDVININNAFIRDYLWKFNLIKELDYEKYSPSYSNYIKNFSYLSHLFNMVKSGETVTREENFLFLPLPCSFILLKSILCLYSNLIPPFSTLSCHYLEE